MSKKVLNSFKILIFLIAASLTAQTESKNSISMPSMPTISQPSIGSGFYMPGRTDFYSPSNYASQKKNSNQSADAQVNSSNTGNNTQTSSTQTTTANSRILSDITKTASSSLNQLTADDISSLSNLGVLGQLSSLLDKNTNLNNRLSTQNSLSSNTITASTNDSETLNKILEELKNLKSSTISENDGKSKLPGETSFSNVVKKEPKILRFNVNGYDLLATCKKIYFSEEETDGTFLLTGDRKYISENTVRNETFYFYFHAYGTENGITKYTVTPAVTQDFENQYSYLYQLTQKNSLSADRTGNLITLRINDNNWKLDLLLSMDK